MKQILSFILSAVTLLSLSACHQEEDELFATAVITLTASDGISIGRVQAQAQLTNVNTRQVTTTADFSGATVQILLLRGAYSVLIEGVAACTDADGNSRLRQFRAQTDYVELAATGVNTTTMNTIFLD